MGLFDFLKKKPAVPEKDKKYYQDESYYTSKAHAGTQFEKTVITFEERKKTAIPSNRGLYPAEILLLDYCSKGTYPGPKNGYPGFWWFEYGIRDVGAALKKLEMEGFIVLGSPKESVKGLTANAIKEILEANGQPTGGKKDELVARVSETVSDDILLRAGVEPKYRLTELGNAELAENEYVPFMHSAHNKTTEDATFGMTYNVWSINKMLGTGDKSNWRSLVEGQESKMNKERADHNASSMAALKKIDPKLYAKLKSDDEVIEAVQSARAKYAEDKDVDWYIAFWEELWKNGGIKIGGSAWHFELPDAYYKAKRYDDALAVLAKLKKDPQYSDRAEKYIEKVMKQKNKAK